MKIPKHVRVVLNETSTIFLLDLPSCVVCREGDEGEATQADNQLYEHLTTGKGRNRKLVTTGVQTLPILSKTRSTEPVVYSFTDNSTFASNWEMYDTYNVQHEAVVHSKSVDQHELNQLEEFHEEETLENSQSFFDAALVIERLLANNCYNDKQKIFKGLISCGDQEVTYDYKLDLLWTFANDETKKRCVTGISFNNLIEDIIAVGYGKYYFMDHNKTGVVMVWNIKNPKQPERRYHFQHAVTCVAFSKSNPNYLAVGFYSGRLSVIDVRRRRLKTVWDESSTSFEPIWDVVWFTQNREEYLLACFGDGRICKCKLLRGNVQIMRIEKVEGRLTGLRALRMFEGNQIASSRFSSAIRLSLHPNDSKRYLVGSNEGVIHTCRTDCTAHHLDMFKAHEGTIHAIKFSPFANKVFATCGDDFQECFWIEGIAEPVVVSRFCTEPVLDLEWSPSHSTILASLRGTDVFLWDLQRKIYRPQSQTQSPTNSRNTLCRFTTCGKSLLVGDIDGNVHIFAVRGLPHHAFFQENALAQAVKTIVATNTELARKIDKLGSLSFDN